MGMHFHVVLPFVFYVCFVAKDSPLQTDFPGDGNLTISATEELSSHLPFVIFARFVVKILESSLSLRLGGLSADAACSVKRA